ncbi:MAG: hypothetical protein HS115_15375 [Spirochaetales bacterium]|nr:hypothetical protein [Spirochaetales bacterium]
MEEHEVWQRLQEYRNDLIEECSLIESVLAENRRRRADWLSWTDSWKRIWLGREKGVSPGPEPSCDIK